MHVIETVTRTGEVRKIHPLTADGIISTAERAGYRVVRKWDSVVYAVGIYRPGEWRAMLCYTVPLI